MTMKDKKKKGRGRPKLEDVGGVRRMVHITKEMLAAINERTKAEQLKDPKIKGADLIRFALAAYFFPPGKRRRPDQKREPSKE
jgi:hypothetical protein